MGRFALRWLVLGRIGVVSGRECEATGDEAMAVPGNVAELLVVRHGETDWNAVGRLQVLNSFSFCEEG